MNDHNIGSVSNRRSKFEICSDYHTLTAAPGSSVKRHSLFRIIAKTLIDVYERLHVHTA